MYIPIERWVRNSVYILLSETDTIFPEYYNSEIKKVNDQKLATIFSMSTNQQNISNVI